MAHRVGVVIANSQKATLIDHLKINSLLETLAARKRIVLVVKVLTFLYLLITKDSHPPLHKSGRRNPDPERNNLPKD